LIQPTGYSNVQKTNRENIQEGQLVPAQKPEVPESKDKNVILNIYEEHLQVTSPTYSKDVKQVMKKENIQETNLNANIIETMNKEGVNVTKDALNIIVNQLQEEHLFKLFEDGYDIERLTVDIIAKEIIQGEVIPVSGEGSTDISEDIAQALAEAGLPSTNKNVEVLEQYKDKVESVIEQSERTISNMIRLKSELTINNLYAAKHSGAPKSAENSPTAEQIIAVLNMNGIKVTQENMSAARNLMGGKIEITKENIKSYIQIQGTINHIDISELLKKAAKEMKKGQNPGDVMISHEIAREFKELEYDEIKQIIEDIKHVDETVIEDTYRKGKSITIGNLQQTLYENVEKVLQGDDRVSLEAENDGAVDLNKIDITKRQLEEIRLSLTLKAALKLNNKLDIKTTELTKVVEELKGIEREHNADILRNTGTPVTEENIGQMQQTSQRLYNISHNKEVAVSQVVQGEADFTLEGMDEAIQLKYAQDIYEDTGTKPERRFGEGIARVEEQIEHILGLNKIEATPSNIKAAKALVQNNVDITQESVETAKLVLLKIETVLYELRPAVVAQILQEGIRLDTMPIDHLIEHIREMQQVIDPNQKVAEAILELDQTNQLNPKEREGLIAVYRMLNTITKNETAAIGFLLENEKEPTLGNLFEASKYIKQVGSKTGKMDVTIDDKLGMREGDLPTNIRTLIKEATNLPVTGQNVDSWLNTKNVMDQWLSRITPEELKTYLDMDKSLEELVLNDGKLSSSEVGQTTKQVEGLGKLSSRTLNFLKEHHISLTIPNIYWADKMIKNPNLLGDMLKDYENLTGEKIDSSINNNQDKQNIEEILDELENELNEQSTKWLSASQSTQAYSIGKNLQQMLGTQKEISQNEGMYQIPVALHHGMSNLNVYVMKDKEQSNKVTRDELKAYMSIKTKHIGVIQVNMRITDKAVAFEMIGETPEITLGLQKGSQELKDAMKEIGYHVMQAKFSQGKPKVSFEEKPKASASLLKYKFAESKFEHII